MKRIAPLALLLMTAMPSVAWPEEPVYFADASLKAAVEDALGKTNPTPTDMLALTNLDARNRGIGDLTGLEKATNLTKVWLPGNHIRNLSPLSALTNLLWLGLSTNQISNLSPLSGLTNLTQLGLHYNQISELSPLSGMTNLQLLALQYNQISDLSPLSGMTNLTELGLFNNQIRNLSPLSGMTNLRRLHLESNQISELSPLSALTNLQWLYLSHNQIGALSPLSGLTNLQELYLRQNALSRTAYCHDLQAILDATSMSATYGLYFDAPNPNPPGGVSASDGTYADKVAVTWEALCAGPGRSDTFQYMVYRSASLEGAKQAISGWLNATSFDDTTVSPGVHYYYWLKSNHSTDFSTPDEGFAGGSGQTLPTAPASLTQLRSDAKTAIPVGGATGESTVVFKANVNDPDGDQVKLQLEVRRLDEYDGKFLNEPTEESDFVDSGEATITVFGLVKGKYHWQARTFDEKGVHSQWVEFGGNNTSDSDFFVAVLGIDVSDAQHGHSNWRSNWSEVYKAGYVFAFVKASEGEGWTALRKKQDPVTEEAQQRYFEDNWKNAAAANLIVGAYHLGRPDLNRNAVEEASWFVYVARGLLAKGGCLRPVLDMEQRYAKRFADQASETELSDWVRKWIDTVELLVPGANSIVYTSPSVLPLLDDQYPLWVANYTCNPSGSPSTHGWSWNFWQFWEPNDQNCGMKDVDGDGVGDWIDINIFNGDVSELSSFVLPTIASSLWRLIVFILACPADMIITDPDGLQISREQSHIPGAIYAEINVDGELQDEVRVFSAKLGEYRVQVTPHPDASPTDTYSLTVTSGDQTLALANNTPIRDIPQLAYAVSLTPTGLVAALNQPVDNLVAVTVGRPGLNAKTGQFSTNVTVKNTSSTWIRTPVWLVIDSVSSMWVVPLNKSGTTSDGKPYFDLSGLLGDGKLDPGESVSQRVNFGNPGRVNFTFKSSVRGVVSP